MQTLKFITHSLVSVLLISCANEVAPEMMNSPLMDGSITSVELETSATPQASEATGTGEDDTNPAGNPPSPKLPVDFDMVDNEDSSPSPVAGEPVEPNEPVMSKPRCVPSVATKNALLSVQWARRNGEASPIEIAAVKLSDPKAKEKLSKIEMDILRYKQLIRTGWGNMELKVLLCDDLNGDLRCSSNEVRAELFAIRPPRLINGRGNSVVHEDSNSDDVSEESDNDDSSEESDAGECSMEELAYEISPNASVENEIRVRMNGKLPVLVTFHF